jgi:uncharacterized membrane protein YccF (DUF307 family)
LARASKGDSKASKGGSVNKWVHFHWFCLLIGWWIFLRHIDFSSTLVHTSLTTPTGQAESRLLLLKEELYKVYL